MAGYPSTDTWSSLTDEVREKLEGYTLVNDQLCSVVGSVGASDTTITVDASDIVSRGIIEIDQEIIFVSASSAGTLTVPSWGRGFKGTTASTHSDGAAVTVAPTFPRAVVAREVNNAVREVWPTLFAAKTTTFTIDALAWQYEMPADCERIVSVDYKYANVDGFRPLDGWELVASADTATFTTGKYLALAEPLMAGITIWVVYAARPTLFGADADELTATTGLVASTRDVIVLGAAARLAPWLDSGRMVATTVAMDYQQQAKQVGNAVAIGRDLRNQYASRLEQERVAQSNLYRLRSHSVRW